VTGTKIDPRNLSAQLHYRGRGNPPYAQPSSAISNCFPGLELDFRAVWRRIFVGIVLVENNNYVVETEGPDYHDLLYHRLLKVDGRPVVTAVKGPHIPGGLQSPWRPVKMPKQSLSWNGPIRSP
jgi:hypothetical protein